MDIKILQVTKDPMERSKCVGRCTGLFHATPIRLDKERIELRKQRVKARTYNRSCLSDAQPVRKAA